MNEQFVTDVFTRFAVHEHLLMQLYVQMAHTTENPDETLAAMEARLMGLMSSLPAPERGIEDWAIKLLQAQRVEGPPRIQEFFRKVRSNRTRG